MPFPFSMASSSSSPGQVWDVAFNQLGQRISQHFVRPESQQDWQELSAGVGSKGPRLFAWARVELAAPEVNGWQRWLLVRQSLDEGTKPATRASNPLAVLPLQTPKHSRQSSTTVGLAVRTSVTGFST